MKNKIDKILNNNVVITLDQQGDEIIIMGKGIGFKKKVGDYFDNALIEKKFVLKNGENVSILSELLSEIPLDVITTTEKIIHHAQTILPGKLHNSLHIALIDHINFALQRHKQGFNIPNSFLWEIKKLYPKEYSVGLAAIDTIHQRLGVMLPEDEAGFITFHIINAQLNDSMSNIMNITNIMREVLNIVKYHFAIEYDEESLYYQRFITHLKFFAQRVLNHNFVPNEDDSLYLMVKDKYPESYLCTEKVSNHLSKSYAHPLTSEEKLFISIHIERLRAELQN